MILCCLRCALKPSTPERDFRSYINFQDVRSSLRPTSFSVYASCILFNYLLYPSAAIISTPSSLQVCVDCRKRQVPLLNSIAKKRLPKDYSQFYGCSQVISAIHATLDTGGWLDLTGRGLAPRKAHQASLGALTPEITAEQNSQARPFLAIFG